MTTQGNAIKKMLDKRFPIPFDFDLFRHPVYPNGLKEKLIVRLELNSLEKVIYALEIRQQNTSFQTFYSNMMQFLTNHMPQPWAKRMLEHQFRIPR